MQGEEWRKKEREGMIGRDGGNSEMNITRNNGAKEERGKGFENEIVRM